MKLYVIILLIMNWMVKSIAWWSLWLLVLEVKIVHMPESLFMSAHDWRNGYSIVVYMIHARIK